MRLVVADAGPLNYLILTGNVDLLPVLFETVVLPTIVYSELTSGKAPQDVRSWIARHPAWIEVIAALKKGLRVTGTLGVLDLSARRGLADFAQAVVRLRRTNFRIPEMLLESLLKKHGQEGENV